MNKKYLITISFVILIISLIFKYIDIQLINSSQAGSIISSKINKSLKNVDSLPVGLVKLQEAYPEFIDSIGDNFLIWNDGTKMVYYEGIDKTNFDTLINNADLHDQMSMKYEIGGNYKIPHKNFDPGRIRNELFFRKMYGNTKKEVIRHLVAIKWLPNSVNKKLLVTTINGVDKKLIEISNELEKIPH